MTLGAAFECGAEYFERVLRDRNIRMEDPYDWEEGENSSRRVLTPRGSTPQAAAAAGVKGHVTGGALKPKTPKKKRAADSDRVIM